MTRDAQNGISSKMSAFDGQMSATDDACAPLLSIVLVTAGGLDELAVALPGLRSQTIAETIELLIVAAVGRVSNRDILGITGFHSVRLVEIPTVGNRAKDAAVAVAVARAEFIGLHENHARAEPETYARILEAFSPRVAAVSPVVYAANAERPWGQAMYAAGHGHAAPPARPNPRPLLVQHSTVYRAGCVHRGSPSIADEGDLQASLVAEGYELAMAPGTVLWHVNESRPSYVLSDTFFLGRQFGHARSRSWSLTRRVVYVIAAPAIVAVSVRRLLGELFRTPESRSVRLRALVPCALTGVAFGFGEVRGYFDRSRPVDSAVERHEFEIVSRMAGHAPAKRWLAEAIGRLPAETR